NASGTNVVVNFDGLPVTYSMSSVAGTVINAGAGDDSINIGPGVPPVTVGGAGGNDTIVTASSNDSVRGGGGDDQLVAGASDDTAVGGAGNDTISAGSGSGDQLFGGPGDDFFTNAGGSGDSVDGGAGLNFAADNSADLLTNIFETYDDNPQAATPDLDTVPDSAGGDDLQIFGTSGNDSITLSDNGQGDLVVVENGGSPQMYPQAGITGILLAGGLGNDTLVAESSVLIPVSLRGAAGNDSLVGGGGDNVIVGGAGSDTLVGGEGTNLLVPTRRVAFEDGSADQDVLIGGPAGSVNIADFSHRTDNVYLSNDGMDHGGVTIMPNVLNIFAGSGQDTVVSTSPGSFMSAGTGTDSLVSGGANTILVAGPNGAGEDTVAASGLANSLFLMNGHADEYEGFTDSDFLQDDPSDISI
ncbi:MAG TPA: calcium-binding protein, partial [Tepidisphaeraceae bacterium]|nr:calcium-binding protein [Tepidisphaeraceae bacterium]